MWFKNLQIYRLPRPWQVTADSIRQQLQRHTMQPIGQMEMESVGWVPPRQGGDLLHVVENQILMSFGVTKKILPASAINQAAKDKASEIEEQQGFKPGRKQMKEIKEQVIDDLLPRALTQFSETRVWIDPVNGWLVIDSGSPAKADEVLKLLFKSIDKLPLETLRVAQSPVAAMTDWLVSDEAPGGFTVDQDAELRANTEGKATVRYVRHTLDPEDVRRHVSVGKQCTRLAMTWADRISFVLTENLTIKRIQPLDILKEKDAISAQNDDERFDSDFLLMTAELSKLIFDLAHAMGGEVIAQPA